MMERLRPLQTHVWANGDTPAESRRTAPSFFITAASVAGAISCKRSITRTGGLLTSEFSESSLFRTT